MKSIKFMGWAWPVEIALYAFLGIVLIAADVGSRFEMWIRALGPVGIMIGVQASVAFGGPVLKRKQENGG